MKIKLFNGYTATRRFEQRCDCCNKLRERTISAKVSSFNDEDIIPARKEFDKKQKKLLSEKFICNTCIRDEMKKDIYNKTNVTVQDLPDLKAYQEKLVELQNLSDNLKLSLNKYIGKVALVGAKEVVIKSFYIPRDRADVLVEYHYISKQKPWRTLNKQDNRLEPLSDIKMFTDEIFTDRVKRKQELES